MEQDTQPQQPTLSMPESSKIKIIIVAFVIIIIAIVGVYIASKKLFSPSQLSNDIATKINQTKNNGNQKSVPSVILEDVPIDYKVADERLVKINKDGSRKVVIERLRETLQEDERTLFILYKFDDTTAYILTSFDVKGLDEEGLNRTIIEVNHSFFKIDLNTGAITESDNQDGVFGDYKQSEIL